MSKVKKTPALTHERRSSKRSVRKSANATAEFHVRELDPQQKCGAGTSVQFLLRVIERSEGRVINHLVFFDQHGWYCEHGSHCPAVERSRDYLGCTARSWD